MSTEDEDKKNAFEKEIKELIRFSFEKANKDSREISKTGKSKHIETEINSKINQRTLVRYYNQYLLELDEGIQPNRSSLDILSNYLNYTDFADFCKQNFPEENRVEEKSENWAQVKISEKPKRPFHQIIAGIGISTVLGLGSYFGISAINQPQCMVWNENHYEAIHCDENVSPNQNVIPMDEKLLEHFHKIEVTDTTTFFEAGKPALWYRKVEGKVEFYTAPGNHPINGKQLSPVTGYIVDKYVFK